MKYSEAILKGYKQNGGKQCAWRLVRSDGAMCVQGAANLGGKGIESDYAPIERWFGNKDRAAFAKEWGVDIINLNNGDGSEMMPWEHLYGMCRAIGR